MWTEDPGYSGAQRWQEFLQVAKQKRLYAKAHPRTHPRQKVNLQCAFRCGYNYQIYVTYETFWKEPRWHVTVGVVEVVESGNQFGLPKEVLLLTRLWPEHHYKNARDLMAMTLGEVLRDKRQKVHEARGLQALHWLTNDPHPDTTPRLVLSF